MRLCVRCCYGSISGAVSAHYMSRVFGRGKAALLPHYIYILRYSKECDERLVVRRR